jgi:glycine/sarcosine/betaine reductase complex component C subunit beta
MQPVVAPPSQPVRRPVIRAVRFALAHVPGLVASGSKPRRELAGAGPEVREAFRAHLRPFAAALAYAPHQVVLGNLAPEALYDLPRPWHRRPVPAAKPEGPAGYLADERTFAEWLVRADSANLLMLEAAFSSRITHCGRVKLTDRAGLERALASGAEPLALLGRDLMGVVLPAHEEDASLAAPVMLENLAAKATGAMALRRLLDESASAGPVDFLVGCGEEAVGDRYQRGGGNLAKAIGELAGVPTAGAVDVKAFCAGPLHALILAGALIASGVHRRVVVVGGGSLAKLGMKCRGHLAADYPILEDVLAGVAIEVVADDGRSPRLRLDTAAVHRIADGSAAHQVAAALSLEPLHAVGLRLTDVDRFAVELHDPDITEPAGSGNVPATNYRMLAAIAVKAGEIRREDMAAFERMRGMPGFSPTQGHIASAIPYLPHAIAGLTDGAFTRVQFIAKGSLFLGRMTGLGDGASIVLERNPGWGPC